MLIASYAKINLFLEVTGKLPDNYHQINTVFSSIDLHDTLRFTLTKKPHLKLWSNVTELISENNLVYRIVSYLIEKYKPNSGVEIFLQKNIPIEAGLGGGSSNAAMTLLAMNTLWQMNLPIEELESIATRFGSDISYFFYGGTAVGSNRGEKIRLVDDILIDHILLVNPGIRISSKTAYDLCKIPPTVRDLPEFLSIDDYQGFNRLELAVRYKYREVDNMIKHLERCGAKYAIMSGSGATCFGVFDSDVALQNCMKEMQHMGIWSRITRTISRDEYRKCFQS